MQIKPDFQSARANLGDAFLQKGQIDEAIAQFQKALEMQPNDAEAEISLGNVFLQKREVNEAIAHYQNAVEIDPDNAEARYNLGNAFLAQDKYGEAITAYEAALRIRPDFFEAHHNLGCVLATIGRTDKALAEFNEAMRVNGNSAKAHFTLGSLLGRMGHREEAVAHLQKRYGSSRTSKTRNSNCVNSACWYRSSRIDFIWCRCPGDFVRTTASSHNLALASSVSRTCGSRESSSLVTQAIPPCAQAVFVSASLLFVVTAAEPCLAVFNAKLRPAMLLP